MKTLSKTKISLLIVGLICLAGLLYIKRTVVLKVVPSSTNNITSLKDQISLNKLPQHIAVMMDGNGRWAARHRKPRIFGHMNSLQSVEETIEACVELQIPYLTLYAFSTENWERPK